MAACCALWVARYACTDFFNAMSLADLIRVVFSVIIPPLGVFFQEGLGLHFWISIVLTLLGYVPGLVHAIWIIARR